MKQTSNKKIQRLIQQGENVGVEFKSINIRPEGLAREIVAFANSSGGSILLGVADNGDITGLNGKENTEEWVANIVRNNVIPAIAPNITQHTLSGFRLLHINVPRGTDKPYQTLDGKYWIRVGSTNRTASKEELSRLFQQAGLVHFDTAPIQNTGINDLDIKKLHQYWSTYYSINYYTLEEKEKIRLLINADILVKQEKKYQVSVGGMLIFGNQPQRKLHQSGIIFAVFNGNKITDELLDKQVLEGTLPELIEQAHTKLRTFIPRPSTINGLKRKEKNTIPDKVLREALVNAVCHRDYSIINRRITVYLFKNRLEISSPGRLPNTLTLEKILTGNSAPRNTFLLKYLDNMKYIDGLGRGVPMIKQAMQEHFEYSEEGEILVLCLRLDK